MKILIADDQPSVCSAIRLLLEQEPKVSRMDEATNVHALLECAVKCIPDLLLLDWGLPGGTPEALLPALRCLNPDIYIIVLDSKPQTGQEALEAGANEFVSKNDPPERLLAAVRSCKNA